MNPAQAELAPHLAAAFKTACLAELEALKPGNVHIFADGHGMVVQDFVHSAEAAAAVIAQPGLAVGQRILSAVESSWNAVGCNTNLGIILLCAPLLHAALHANGKPLRESLHAVLQALTVADAEYAYRAIVQASPAGLGHSARHDVRQPPRTTLLEAMREAQHIDRIAWQYVHDFTDVIEFGAARYRYFLNAWERPAWAATAVYLGFLSDYPDSHIARKHGRMLHRPCAKWRFRTNRHCLPWKTPRSRSVICSTSMRNSSPQDSTPEPVPT